MCQFFEGDGLGGLMIRYQNSEKADANIVVVLAYFSFKIESIENFCYYTAMVKFV